VSQGVVDGVPQGRALAAGGGEQEPALDGRDAEVGEGLEGRGRMAAVEAGQERDQVLALGGEDRLGTPPHGLVVAPHLGGDGADGAAAGESPLGVRPVDGLEPRPHRRPTRPAGHRLRLPPADPFPLQPENLGHELGLAAEVVVELALAGPGGGQDPGDAGAVDAVEVEQLRRGLHDALAGNAAAGGGGLDHGRCPGRTGGALHPPGPADHT